MICLPLSVSPKLRHRPKQWGTILCPTPEMLILPPVQTSDKYLPRPEWRVSPILQPSKTIQTTRDGPQCQGFQDGCAPPPGIPLEGPVPCHTFFGCFALRLCAGIPPCPLPAQPHSDKHRRVPSFSAPIPRTNGNRQTAITPGTASPGFMGTLFPQGNFHLLRQ